MSVAGTFGHGLDVKDCPVLRMRRELLAEGYVPAGQHAQMLANLGVPVEAAVARCEGFSVDNELPQAHLVNFAPRWAMSVASQSPSRWLLKSRKLLLSHIIESAIDEEERDDLIAVAVAAHKGRLR